MYRLVFLLSMPNLLKPDVKSRTTSEWSTILLSKVRFILEVWRYEHRLIKIKWPFKHLFNVLTQRTPTVPSDFIAPDGDKSSPSAGTMQTTHDDVIKWKHFRRYWTIVRVIHRSAVNSSHRGQWRGALMFPLICAWTNGSVNNRDAGIWDPIILILTAL